MNVPARGSEEITPPSSFRGPPLTPPPTDEKEARDTSNILRQIAKHRSGNTGQTTHKVDKRVWAAVSSLLLRDDKLQLDYFPSIECLVLRMPTKVHEQFSRSLTGRITEQLRLLSHGSGSAADFAKDIRDVGSATIRPRDPEYGTHNPDSSFQHLKSPSPTVVIEVAHSQKGEKLRTLAEEYILGSDLEIGVVVGVDIEYSKSKRATFSVWRARLQGPEDDRAWVVEPTVANQIFRHDDGNPSIGQNLGLHLRLEDFADQKTCQQFKDIDGDIFVSCDELYQYLEEAETIAKIAESTKPERNPRLKKRRRTQTPEEQLDDRDEDAYAEDEAHVSKRRDLDDTSYKESSPECT
ncbi:hypothetical protein DV736_g6632, partial [Chaetothyriales sp. CBS 134916]